MASGTRRLRTANLAAGATSPNLLADDTLRYPGVDSLLEVAGTGDQADMNLTVEVGNTIVYDGVMPIEDAAGRGPILPDDVLTRTGVTAGDQISIRVRNDAVGADEATVLVNVEPA